MQPDAATPEIVELASIAIAAQQDLDAALEACNAARAAAAAAEGALQQALTDLANGLGAAGITLSTFQHDGHLFTEGAASPFAITLAPPHLTDVGAQP